MRAHAAGSTAGEIRRIPSLHHLSTSKGLPMFPHPMTLALHNTAVTFTARERLAARHSGTAFGLCCRPIDVRRPVFRMDKGLVPDQANNITLGRTSLPV
jgi:hypothetical protein